MTDSPTESTMRRIADALERLADAVARLQRTAVIVDAPPLPPRPPAGSGVTQDGTQPERMR